jgi:uncharacterized membrane protein SpoIIM required for sporulation
MIKEIVFLNSNAQKWKRFEKLLNSAKTSNPDEIADLFIEITDDLAYSRTFYKRSATTAYLNSLALKAYRLIYKNKKESYKRLITFWTLELPLIYKEKRANIIYSLLIFLIAIGIGAISAANNIDFVRIILGDQYVDMTLENIKNNDPMAVYKSMQQTDMFFFISLNNIYVSFLAFIYGIFLSVGTAYVLFSNGIMLGSFQYFFYEHGVFTESVLTIWIHGTLEIWAIVVAGASGLVMGNSILFPKTYSRLHSFTQASKMGIKMVIGLVPIFIVAAFLEGFVTRHTEFPDVLRLSIILLSAGFIVWYFFLYPEKVFRQKILNK